jgi:hypothetical protein
MNGIYQVSFAKFPADVEGDKLSRTPDSLVQPWRIAVYSLIDPALEQYSHIRGEFPLPMGE